jgi:hypothetical protein
MRVLKKSNLSGVFNGFLLKATIPGRKKLWFLIKNLFFNTLLLSREKTMKCPYYAKTISDGFFDNINFSYILIKVLEFN